LIKTINWVIDNDIFNHKNTYYSLPDDYKITCNNIFDPDIKLEQNGELISVSDILIDLTNRISKLEEKTILSHSLSSDKNSIQRQLGYFPENLKDIKDVEICFNPSIKNYNEIHFHENLFPDYTNKEYKNKPIEEFKKACEYYEKEFGISIKDNYISEVEIMFAYKSKDMNLESHVVKKDIFTLCKTYTKLFLNFCNKIKYVELPKIIR
jgi:hypothetical protein